MRRLFLVILTAFLVSCQMLPVISPPSLFTSEESFACPFPFLKEPHRLVHAIEFRMGGKAQSAIIGVTLANPFTGSVSCAIMTVEGIVVFEAEAKQNKIKVKRALPPFDSKNFAKNLIEDIKLIFFIPEGKLQQKGCLHDGSKVCRYLQKNGDWVDVIKSESGGKQVKRYTSSGVLKRHVLFNKTPKNIYRRIELEAYENMDYSLLMNLIEVQPLKTQAVKRK